MHCIQGSDSHRLEADPKDDNILGVGERATEVLLPEVSFEALKAVFLGDDFARTRPYRPAEPSYDFVQAARESGPSIVQSFHEQAARKGAGLTAILRDVVAFANTNGGTIFIGAGVKSKGVPVGVDRADDASRALSAEIGRAVAPPLDVGIDVLKSQGKNVLRVTVPRGSAPPYALDGMDIFIRQESETSRAMRDEIVQLVLQATRSEPVAAAVAISPPPTLEDVPELVGDEQRVPPPRTGVEIVEVVERHGTKYYVLRDLRNGNTVQNVTIQSARRLWRYAVTEYENHPVQPDQVQWRGDIGMWKTYQRSGRKRYDLVQRGADGKLQYYYGVTEDGVHGDWAQFVDKI